MTKAEFKEEGRARRKLKHSWSLAETEKSTRDKEKKLLKGFQEDAYLGDIPGQYNSIQYSTIVNRTRS